MTVNEILNRLTPEDIANAMTSFKTEPYQRKGIKGEYQLVYEQDVFPVRELIMRATNRELKDSENPDSYTTVVAKNKLIELGFTNFLDSLKMYTYYLKKASKQDVEKTTVINIEAVTQFFGVSLINKDDTATVTIHYLSDNTTDTSVQLLKKQDPRIFIDRTRFPKEIFFYIFQKVKVFLI